MNLLTLLASWMPSELPGLFNKLAFEYCSAPSPFAMAEITSSSVEFASEINTQINHYPPLTERHTVRQRVNSMRTDEMWCWQQAPLDVIFFLDVPASNVSHSPHYYTTPPRVCHSHMFLHQKPFLGNSLYPFSSECVYIYKQAVTDRSCKCSTWPF